MDNDDNNNSNNNNNKNGVLKIPCKPFEWLTSAESLKPILDPLIAQRQEEEEESAASLSALHVGCGSSTVGEWLLQEYKNIIHRVVNVDKDEELLNQMRQRWLDNDEEECIMQFRNVDFDQDNNPAKQADDDDEKMMFDFILDKSTLDCTLCSQNATAGLFCFVYRQLAPGGYYIIISFHHQDFITSLLRHCPGMQWEFIKHDILIRKVENILSPSPLETTTTSQDDDDPTTDAINDDNDNKSNEPRTVNVFICRKHTTKASGADDLIDRSLVQEHIYRASDEWFQSKSPLLSADRQLDLTKAFFPNKVLDLKECYLLLFTPQERSYFTFDLFIEDWQAYGAQRKQQESSSTTTNETMPTTGQKGIENINDDNNNNNKLSTLEDDDYPREMTLDMALDFLRVMQ